MDLLSPQFLTRVAADRAEIEALTEAAFLAGPHRPDCDLDIDDIFAKPLEDVVADFIHDLGEEVASFDLSFYLAACREAHVAEHPDPEGPVMIVEALGMDFMPHVGVLAIREGRQGPELLGAYLGHALAVRPDARGQGIGTRLVAGRFLHEGALPTWWEDEPAYSRAGEATHRAAFRLLHAALELAPVRPTSPASEDPTP